MLCGVMRGVKGGFLYILFGACLYVLYYMYIIIHSSKFIFILFKQKLTQIDGNKFECFCMCWAPALNLIPVGKN